ncbi:ABC transporter, permease protein [Gleimia coleocanis DSM 15436]|uniref:ABC transporter, permease protein n=1 Tax=Gleimia coleocanis DSM 15436 TaxID=525245 RepID=C0W255_9ACTO|nr:iron ABC transporter permease [Gleimia coleocanis]EEH63269.1 ABC transporter, permease protein [Gleimia coleocanis DSM 15436]
MGRRAFFTDRVSKFLGTLVAVGVPVVFLSLFFLYPTFSLILRGFIDDAGEWDFSGFTAVLGSARVWRAVWQTLWLSAVATFFSLTLSVPAAWTLYRLRFPGRAFLRGLVAVPFVLPSVVVGVAFRSLFSEGGLLGAFGLDGTATAVIVGMVFFNFSLAVRTVGNLWVRLDPRMEEAAASLGANPLRVFFGVTFPRLLPALSAAGALVFLFCATSFGLVLILSGTSVSTVETEIYFLTTALLDLRSAAVLSIVQLLVIALSLWVSKRAQNFGARTQKLRTDVVASPVRVRDLPAVLFTFAVVVILLVLPLVNMLVSSWRRGGEWTFSNYLDLFVPRAARVLKEPVWFALLRSFEIAVYAAGIALVIGVLVSVVISRRPTSRFSKLSLSGLDALFALPLGVSAVTVGFGFLISLDAPPLDFRQSWWLIPLAQAMVAVPLVVRLVSGVLEQIDPRQLEAAAVLGAPWYRVLWAVELPLASRSMVLAGAFAMAMSLGEFGATSFLARPAEPTLPVVIYRLVGKPGAAEQGMAVAASVILAVCAALLMVVAEAWFDRSGVKRNTPAVGK